jgi:small subunit ribosomal protein S15
MPKAKTSKKIEKPAWLKYTKEEVEAIILKLDDKGLTAEKIGLTLRDQYGIPKAKIYNLKISEILKQKEKFTEPTLLNLEKKLEEIKEHYKKNKQDKKAERSLMITKAKLKKIKDYLKKKGK